ncbi:MAG: DUF1003 domain-containing protein [Candidatus Eremiobacteraeota bacterium]|nr:DUF1003 domain-containing protein [Candidatus Eremiobacteraeota bacterium]
MVKNNKSAQAPLDRAVQSLADVQAQHLQELPRSQLGIEWLTDRIGRPWFAYAVVGFIAVWIGVDTLLARHGRFDAASFPILQLLMGALSLVMASFILITENRQGTIAEKRAQLTLQLSLANEERTAKIIALLEELRQDDPSLPDRHDEEARQMAEAIDLKTAIEKMEEAESAVKDRSQL